MVANARTESLHSSMSTGRVPREHDVTNPIVRQARRDAAFVNEVYAEMNRRFRFVPGEERVVPVKPMRLVDAWAAAMKPAAPLEDDDVVIGVADMLRARRKPKMTFAELLTPTNRRAEPWDEDKVEHLVGQVAARAESDPEDLVGPETAEGPRHAWKGQPPKRPSAPPARPTASVPRAPRAAKPALPPAPKPPHPLEGPLLEALRSGALKTSDDLAWDLGEAPLDVDDALVRLEARAAVQKVHAGKAVKWRVRK